MCSKLSPPGIYLLRWDGLGGGGGGVACAARLCHGRSGRDRHEPVLEPSPVPLTQARQQTLSGMKPEPSPAGKSSCCYFPVERWLLESAVYTTTQHFREINLHRYLLFDFP